MGRVHGKFIIKNLPEFMGNSLSKALVSFSFKGAHKGPKKPIMGTTLGTILRILGGAQSALDSLKVQV